MITTATPITQIALANQVLGEPLGWYIAGGGALIIVGILAMALAERYAPLRRVRSSNGSTCA